MNHNGENVTNPASFAFVPAVISTDSARVTNGTNFAVSADTGDILPHSHQGFYAHDTRFLSQFILTLNGKRLSGVGHATFEDVLASFYCSTGRITVVRDRYVSATLHEDISITNYFYRPCNISLKITFGTDFADVFEVRRGAVTKTGKITRNYSEEDGLVIAYRKGDYIRETRLTFSVPPEVKASAAYFRFKLMPKEIWKMCIEVKPVIDVHEHPSSPCVSEILGKPFGAYEEKSFLGFFQEVNAGMPLKKIPALKTEIPDLAQAFHRAVGDLRALRLHQEANSYVLAAGLPWFMAVFGRDSIISAIQTKLLGPELMKGTLSTLAGFQATEFDAFREAEPGKIIHEVRKGELSLLGNMPHIRYYGSVDSTPLFIVLLREAYQWTGDRKLLDKFFPNAQKALEWIEKYGDIDGDGFVEYRRRIGKGLLNQGWKDSSDSISFSDGAFASGTIALAEVQGYVYAAKICMADMYEKRGNLSRAVELRNSAMLLKKRFNDAFWMPEHDYYAIALDGKKNRVDSISSNPGHCLWSGIISEEKAPKVARRLMAPDMFNGWGVRTLSCEAKRYNPLSYHNGSIWPHDNSIIAAGLKRYGFYEEASRIANSIIEATALLPSHRLPELFAGYPRRSYSFPVPYPAANSPQAWASGSVIFLMETMLDITAGDESLIASPSVKAKPPFILSGVRYRNKKQSLP